MSEDILVASKDKDENRSFEPTLSSAVEVGEATSTTDESHSVG